MIRYAETPPEQPVQPTVSTGTAPETRAQAIEFMRQQFVSKTSATPEQALEAATELVDQAIAQRGG